MKKNNNNELAQPKKQYYYHTHKHAHKHTHKHVTHIIGQFLDPYYCISLYHLTCFTFILSLYIGYTWQVSLSFIELSGKTF